MSSKLAAALALLTACAGASDAASAHGHPVPAPTPRPYESIGSIDVGTLENTIFWWRNNTYVLENIGCGYGKLPPSPNGLSTIHRALDFSAQTVFVDSSSSISA